MFPGGPGVKTVFTASTMGSSPGWATNPTCHAPCPKLEKKRTCFCILMNISLNYRTLQLTLLKALMTIGEH